MERTRSTQREEFLLVRRQLIFGAVLFFSFLLLIYLGCLLVGQCYVYYDATLTELGVCLDTDYQPVVTVPSTTEQLFLCGKVVGTTPHQGGLFLFFKDRVIYNTNADQRPGTFFQPLPVDRIRQPGRYRIEIWYAMRILASTEFEVVLP